MSTPKMYGIIDESCFSLHFPRVLDEGPFETLAEAFKEAQKMINEGYTTELVIRPARYSKRHTCYLEDWTTHAQVKIETCEEWAILHEDEEEAA